MGSLANVEGHSVNFFATGDVLNLNFIPGVNLCKDGNRGGVPLTGVNQDLQQSYLTAKNIFEHVKPGTIKFVLIGLAPYAVSDNDEEPPIALPLEKKILEDYIKLCLDNGAKPVVVVLPVKWAIRETYGIKVLKLFRDTINNFKNNYELAFIDLLDVKLADSCFQDKTHLNSEGRKAIGALLSEKLYFNDIISPKEIYSLPDEFFDTLSKYFPKDYKIFTNHIFCKMACGHFKLLSEILPQDVCKDTMARVFSEKTYDHLAKLSNMLSKDDYNDLLARTFKISAEKIRRKDKIKVGFITYDSSMWCGDELYKLFAANPRFELTIFFCLRRDKTKDEIVKNDFLRGVEQFKQRGLNVVALGLKKTTVPDQDVLIFLTPYLACLPASFRLMNIFTKTLTVYIPYAFDTAKYNAASYSVVWTAWKAFLSSLLVLKIYEEKIAVGLPRGLYSGYSRMDIFFRKDSNFHFDWKLAQPNAKKIIWAPHWSINRAIKYATFQWNYKLMYEFAKAHPETSWVVKPHPNLLFSAVSQKVFPSAEAFKKYLQAWDDLPNAKVVTGGYYQDLFATSDGMIHDSGSFTAEYQYVNKPMIYLTNKTQEHNELGNEILKASYTVDGSDLKAIAELMQRVFIEGDDYKAAERKNLFDKYLNYPKANGMLASEFIYKTIADELKGEFT